MRESLASAVGSSNLEVDPDYERHADRLAAMAFGPRLGSILLRYRDGNQKKWRGEVVAMLAHKVIRKHRLNAQLSIKIASCALDEWDSPQCKSCRGAREIMGPELKIVCPDCGGSGIRRYSDDERRKVIGAWGGKVSTGYDVAMAAITAAMASVVGAARVQLER